ncbi:DUF262 domain-containing protein [Aeromicrobium tamlense]|uniref:DUF262 domain-containing protein n=1 Tax=Aeromicrobium tamlense TaxID=375541 RepID=A0A8I0FZ97_9ACTN|nr:DUF262 domain-containing protein [Aeromicrobium tamlense]MBD1271720.1 DUF262 domain-containing protein [Aeromicrobium tamlense]NYI37532.1 hypothetical protein [Aeromicrobium tamlense]
MSKVSETMKGEQISLRELIDGNICFEIPTYQRTYEWTAEDWRRLFADVLAQESPTDVGGKFKPKHFMGTVLTETSSSSVKRATFSLVDGQQRFVTLALLSAAIRHRALEESGGDPEADGTSWFTHAPAGIEPMLRLVPQRSDRMDFEAAIGGQWRDVISARMGNESAIWQAYSYFRFLLALGRDAEPMLLSANTKVLDRLPMISISKFDPANVESQWIEKLESIEAARPGEGLPPGARKPWNLTHLQSAVNERLFFYNLQRGSNDEDTSIIFETINASGKGLFPLDLVKNSIFMRISDPANREEVFDKYWHPAEERLSKTTWPKKRAPYQDVFLYDYLIGSGEHSRQGSLSQARGYSHFLRKVDSDVPRTAKDYDARLDTFLREEFFPAAAVWPVAVGAAESVMFEGKTRKVPKAALSRISSLMAVSAGPPVPMVMIALVRWLRKDAGWTDSGLNTALAAVDSYVTRAAVCLSGISNLRSSFMVICGKLPGYGGTLSVAEFKLPLKAAADSDSDVRRAFLELDLYAKMKSDALMAVFRGIEAALTKAGGPHAIESEIYSIEHVFPQDSRRWAPDFAKWGLSASDIERLGARLHCIGNLTPITRPHNSSLRNKPYAEKKVGIKQDAAGLKVHKGILTSQSWTSKQIDTRGKVLAEAFIKQWPKP